MFDAEFSFATYMSLVSGINLTDTASSMIDLFAGVENELASSGSRSWPSCAVMKDT
ncbi:hypothetical protein [Mycobacterium malmoense]|uniref:hypothetical protein n=1 Tax=Mycobacterium malmoense TaxID=1780 RepID=UPI0015A5E385|nr:hypothetical protein [Mycobacterium malmoense]